MCGICGFVNLKGEPVDEDAGRRMTELMWHRGPDDEGALVRNSTVPGEGPSVFLGHRRLKIIDLSSSARQPLPNEDETVWTILNGEIYNFVDLRNELGARGHVFRSRGDTETIVHAYEEFGDDFVQHLDGMFAFALWDDRRGRLILARDRSGKKPLFYCFDGRRLTFASEIKALLACPWVDRRIAIERIPEYLSLGYVLAPATLYRDVLQVPPASCLVLDRESLEGPRRYWELGFAESAGGSRSPWEVAQRVRDLLTEAVARRLISDVRLGALLSGGLDSSIVVGLMAGLSKEPVRTFTIGFEDDASYDERPYAAIAAKHFKTAHTEYAVRIEALALMEHLLWHHDQPYGDSSAIPTYIVSKIACQDVTVALNGDGGDEVFAGYDRFRAGLLAERLPRVISFAGGVIARRLRDGHGYYSARRRLRRFFGDAHLPVQRRFIGWMSLFDARSVNELLRPEVTAMAGRALAEAPIGDLLARTAGLPLLNQLLYLNFMTYLPGDLHVKMDRMSMANSLETRSPMLDTALVEYVASLPPDLKIRRGEMKYILKAAFCDLLPPVLLERKKHAFSVPVGAWFRRQHRQYVEEIVLARSARLNAYLNPDATRRLMKEHVEGSRDRGHQLWALLNFELWLRMLESGELTVPRKARGDGLVDITVSTRGSYSS